MVNSLKHVLGLPNISAVLVLGGYDSGAIYLLPLLAQKRIGHAKLTSKAIMPCFFICLSEF